MRLSAVRFRTTVSERFCGEWTGRLGLQVSISRPEWRRRGRDHSACGRAWMVRKWRVHSVRPRKGGQHISSGEPNDRYPAPDPPAGYRNQWMAGPVSRCPRWRGYGSCQRAT